MKSLEDKAKENEVFYVMVGELSTHDTLKHIHPEHLSTISKQIWDKAKDLGRKAAIAEMIERAYDSAIEAPLGDYVDLNILEKIAEDLIK